MSLVEDLLYATVCSIPCIGVRTASRGACLSVGNLLHGCGLRDTMEALSFLARITSVLTRFVSIGHRLNDCRTEWIHIFTGRRQLDCGIGLRCCGNCIQRRTLGQHLFVHASGQRGWILSWASISSLLQLARIVWKQTNVYIC